MKLPDALQEEAREPRSERELALQGGMRARGEEASRVAIVVAALLFAFPQLTVSLEHWASGIYGLVGVITLFAWRRTASPLRREEKLFLGIIAGYVAATLLANTLSGWTRASVGWFEADLRVLFAVPVFLFLRRHPETALWLMRAVPVAAIITGGHIIFETGVQNARFEGAYGPIFAGNVAALLAVLCLAALCYDNTWPRGIRLPLHLAGFVFAMVGAIFSGTRGAWLAAAVALPVVLFFMLENVGVQRRRRLALGAIALVAAVLAAAVTMEPKLTQHRFAVAVKQAENFINAETPAERAKAADTSIGIRLEQWRNALRIAAEHPAFGIGVGNVGPLINAYIEAGTASPAIYVDERVRGSHLHSAYFDALVFKGVIGLAALLCLLLYPLWLCAKHGRHLPSRPALVGLSVSFLVFSLTEDPFIRNNFTSIYLMFLACLLALLFSGQRAAR